MGSVHSYPLTILTIGSTIGSMQPWEMEITLIYKPPGGVHTNANPDVNANAVSTGGSPPPPGAYIYGLFMEAARFDRDSVKLVDMIPRKLFDAMPCIWLKPVITADYNPTNVYDCPLYKTSLRAGTLSTTGHSTNFVVSLPIPSDHSEDHWIRRGTAMLCMLDD